MTSVTTYTLDVTGAVAGSLHGLDYAGAVVLGLAWIELYGARVEAIVTDEDTGAEVWESGHGWRCICGKPVAWDVRECPGCREAS